MQERKGLGGCISGKTGNLSGSLGTPRGLSGSMAGTEELAGELSKEAKELDGTLPGELIFYAPEFDGPTVILVIDGVDHAVDNITNPVPTDKPGEYSFEII